MLRYRTKDITRLTDEPCKCGRTTMRMMPIEGRSDDMLIVRGTNLFPSQIESVLLGMEEVGPHYQLIVRKNGFMDAVEVQVELKDSSLLERYKDLQALEQKVRANLKSVLLLDAKVKLVEPKTLERFTGKAKRVIDLRNQK